mmetsp:Transcript_90674/g.207497  ORF Transcript_90674/g.207497 Transcript_90674/m.207497 type:complete len:104 (-) Transcript_90674:159-470(-)
MALLLQFFVQPSNGCCDNWYNSSFSSSTSTFCFIPPHHSNSCGFSARCFFLSRCLSFNFLCNHLYHGKWSLLPFLSAHPQCCRAARDGDALPLGSGFEFHLAS